jgi:hypothetical protein
MVTGQSLSTERGISGNVIPPGCEGTLIVTYSKLRETKKNNSNNELTDRLNSADFNGFEFLGRLGYDGRMNVSYDTSELRMLSEEKKVITAEHFIYNQLVDSFTDISFKLEKLFSEMKIQNKISGYDSKICYDYAIATQKILDVIINSDSSQDYSTGVYFVIAQPNKSPPGVNGSHFESAEIRMFLLKYNLPKNTENITHT